MFLHVSFLLLLFFFYFSWQDKSIFLFIIVTATSSCFGHQEFHCILLLFVLRYRRTRAVFDMAVRIHKHIQERDIEVGRNLGNWILRWLDKAKPSAEIRGPQLLHNTIVTKQLTNVLHKKTPSPAVRTICSLKNGFRESGKHLFSSTRTMWRNRFPPITMMMPGINNQYRNMSIYGPQVFKSKYVGFGSEGVVRKDIVDWLVRN